MRYFRLDISLFPIYHPNEIAIRDIFCAANAKNIQHRRHAAGGGITLIVERENIDPDFAWDAFALAEYVSCPLTEAFRLLLTPHAAGMGAAEAVLSARLLLRWRELPEFPPLVRLLRGLYLEDDHEGFLLILSLWQQTQCPDE